MTTDQIVMAISRVLDSYPHLLAPDELEDLGCDVQIAQAENDKETLTNYLWRLRMLADDEFAYKTSGRHHPTWDEVDRYLAAHCGCQCWYGRDGQHIHNENSRGDLITWDALSPKWLCVERRGYSGRKALKHKRYVRIIG